MTAGPGDSSWRSSTPAAPFFRARRGPRSGPARPHRGGARRPDHRALRSRRRLPLHRVARIHIGFFVAEQTALLAEMESGSGFHQFAVAGKSVGPAAHDAAEDVVAAARERRVDAVLADGVPGILIGAQATVA